MGALYRGASFTPNSPQCGECLHHTSYGARSVLQHFPMSAGSGASSIIEFQPKRMRFQKGRAEQITMGKVRGQHIQILKNGVSTGLLWQKGHLLGKKIMASSGSWKTT
jgi:hypothetical protein